MAEMRFVVRGPSTVVDDSVVSRSATAERELITTGSSTGALTHNRLYQTAVSVRLRNAVLDEPWFSRLLQRARSSTLSLPFVLPGSRRLRANGLHREGGR